MKTIAIAALFVVGCEVSPVGVDEVKPGQVEAQRIAWSVFGEEGEAPKIYWVQGAQLNCAAGAGWLTDEAGCVGGMTWEGETWSDVAWWPGMPFHDMPIADAAASCDVCMVHEMAHVASASNGHSDRFFAAGGLVDQANAAIAAAGTQ